METPGNFDDHSHNVTAQAGGGFGRGWIPADRDIGLAGEDCAAEPRHDGWTAARKARFLDLLAHRGNVRAACAAVGMSAEAAYRLRRREPAFARAWAGALLLARGVAEQALADRALDGVSEPIFYRGEQVGSRVKHDSRLLLAHLARLDTAAEDETAREAAERFDEMVALALGAEVEEAMQDDDGMPLTREDYAYKLQGEAEKAMSHELYGDPWAVSPSCLDEDDEDEEEDHPDPILVAGQEARAAAEAGWDAWHARACAMVDGKGEPFLPDTGRGTAPRSAGEEEPPIEFKSLDPVNFVNFAGWRPGRGGVRLAASGSAG